MASWRRVHDATAHLSPPLAAVDGAALDANAADLVRRAGGTPIRIATKSVRCRAVLDRVLTMPGFSGLMGYSLAEAIWLVREGATDVLVAYPTVDRNALAELAGDEALLAAITVMVDDPDHVRIIREVGAADPIRVCLDVDASLRVGSVHLGTRRSSVHSVAQATSAARHMSNEPSVRLVGIMFYDAQVAGLPDSSVDVRAMKQVSIRELRHRRPRIVEAVGRFAQLDLVNAGGSGCRRPVPHRGRCGIGPVRTDSVRWLSRLHSAACLRVRPPGHSSPRPGRADSLQRRLRSVRSDRRIPAADAVAARGPFRPFA